VLDAYRANLQHPPPLVEELDRAVREIVALAG
jgi:hypothetical protein